MSELTKKALKAIRPLSCKLSDFHLTAQRRAVLDGFTRLYKANLVRSSSFAWIKQQTEQDRHSEVIFKIQISEQPNDAEDVYLTIMEINHDIAKERKFDSPWRPYYAQQIIKGERQFIASFNVITGEFVLTA